jgi:hypothetical protein
MFGKDKICHNFLFLKVWRNTTSHVCSYCTYCFRKIYWNFRYRLVHSQSPPSLLQNLRTLSTQPLMYKSQRDLFRLWNGSFNYAKNYKGIIGIWLFPFFLTTLLQSLFFISISSSIFFTFCSHLSFSLGVLLRVSHTSTNESHSTPNTSLSHYAFTSVLLIFHFTKSIHDSKFHIRERLCVNFIWFVVLNVVTVLEQTRIAYIEDNFKSWQSSLDRLTKAFCHNR